MALCTAVDMQNLNGRKVLTGYFRWKSEFVDVGKLVYKALSATSVPPQGNADLEGPLTDVLLCSKVFIRVITTYNQHTPGIQYPGLAAALARYMLDAAWNDISSP